MPQIQSSRSSEHYTWGQSCDGWHLLRTPHLSIIEERMPASTSESRHFHAHAHQFFYILAGELTLNVAGETLILHANEGVEISPGTPHQVFNGGLQAARFLVISHPPSHGDRTDV